MTTEKYAVGFLFSLSFFRSFLWSILFSFADSHCVCFKHTAYINRLETLFFVVCSPKFCVCVSLSFGNYFVHNNMPTTLFPVENRFLVRKMHKHDRCLTEMRIISLSHTTGRKMKRKAKRPLRNHLYNTRIIIFYMCAHNFSVLLAAVLVAAAEIAGFTLLRALIWTHWAILSIPFSSICELNTKKRFSKPRFERKKNHNFCSHNIKYWCCFMRNIGRCFI